jgi:hypothetical protein
MIPRESQKQKITITLEPWIKKRVTVESKKPEFGSASHLVNLALTEFFERRDNKKSE